MAYFNPHPVTFNYDTKTIDAVGALGKSLYEIYMDNVKKNQIAAKLSEENRANLEAERLNAARNSETARHNQATEYQTAQKDAFNRDIDMRRLGLDSEWRRAQINNLYADNARANAQLQWSMRQAQDKARAEQEKQANLDLAWYDAGQKGGQFKNLNPNLSHEDKIRLGREYRLQTEAQGTLNKIYEPVEKANIQKRNNRALVSAVATDPRAAAALGIDPASLQGLDEQGIQEVAADISAKINAGKAFGGLGLDITKRTRQPTSKERDTLAGLATLAQQLNLAKTGFNSAMVGPGDNFVHWAAKGVGAQDVDTENFKLILEGLPQQTRSLLGTGRLSNQQYADFMRVMPKADSWTAKEYMTKSDAMMNLLETSMRNQLTTLKASGIDTSSLEEEFSPIFEIFGNGYFNKKARTHANGEGMDASGASAAPINSTPQPPRPRPALSKAEYDAMAAYDENGVRYDGDEFDAW